MYQVPARVACSECGLWGDGTIEISSRDWAHRRLGILTGGRGVTVGVPREQGLGEGCSLFGGGGYWDESGHALFKLLWQSGWLVLSRCLVRGLTSAYSSGAVTLSSGVWFLWKPWAGCLWGSWKLHCHGQALVRGYLHLPSTVFLLFLSSDPHLENSHPSQ